MARRSYFFLTAAVAALLLLGGVYSTLSGSAESPPVTSTTIPGPTGLVVIPEGGAELAAEIAGEVLYRAHEGLVFPVVAESGDWLRVMTTCSDEGWVRRAQTETIPAAFPSNPGPGFDLSEAVIVVDPGHGGRDEGAIGPGQSEEKEVNLAIAELLRKRLETSNDIDWATGTIRPGDEYPSIGAVWMTRESEGPNGGDVFLGLAYRAVLANSAGADALVSIHNNSSPSQTTDYPGSAVFYAVSSPGSDRLASLIHEELLLGLGPFASEWGSGKFNGPMARVDTETGDDFYGLLRRAESPAVIIEGLYISRDREEQLLGTQLVRQAYADAVYRGLVRFLTTDSFGTEVRDPDPFSGDVGSPSTSSCEVPVQP